MSNGGSPGERFSSSRFATGLGFAGPSPSLPEGAATVDVQFFAENTGPGPFFALWACLQAVAEPQRGYRLHVESVTEPEGKKPAVGSAFFQVQLERLTGAGTAVVLAKAYVEQSMAGGEGKAPEGKWIDLNLTVSAGTVSAHWAGAMVASAEDSTYSEGMVGLEGEGIDAFGARHFKHNGAELDSLERVEDPLNLSPWELLPWVGDMGKCYEQEGKKYGWVSKKSPGRSGAYWLEVAVPQVAAGPATVGRVRSVRQGVR